MKEFNALVEVADHLLGPEGCPWDREQTLASMRSEILEEVHELIEAIDLGKTVEIREELGDLFFNIVFLCRLAEKENHCDMPSVLEDITNKLISRHPHVFGEEKITSSSAVLEQWDQLKAKEKADRKSVLDGIPGGLPALSRARKALKKMKHSSLQEYDFESEEELGKFLVEVVTAAQKKGLHPEQALKKELSKLERDFRLAEEL